MKRAASRVLGLLSFIPLAGCAELAADCDLPGDIDCADPVADKGDQWNSENDPRYFASHLEYTLAKLPKVGFLDEPVWRDRYPDAVGKAPVAWADTYWPSSEGSHNKRWLGEGERSPLEKYDAAFHGAAGCATQPPAIHGEGAKAQWDAYYACAGPAATWQMRSFQSISRMHNGVDDNHDGAVDDYGTDRSLGIDGIQGWWGTCHAWAPAALMMPEPQHAVTLEGQRFEVGDIKALIQNVYDRTSAVMLGGRCNNLEISHDVNGSANDDCADVNPGGLHVIVTNFIGLRRAPLVEDRTANYEVWNQPILGFEVLREAEVAAPEANACVGATGESWSYNPNAARLHEVTMRVTYLGESGASRRPLGWEGHTSSDTYHYILELNDAGKIVGGRYCSDSSNTHIDFLWSPTGQHSPSNPHVDVARVKQLVALSLEPQHDGGGGTREFRSAAPADIPDGDPAGVNIDIPVSGVTGARGLTVSVDITHTYRGDLVLKLLKDGAPVKTLIQSSGGSADNLVESYTLVAAEIGSDVDGRWTVNVADTEAQDRGRVNAVTLAFQL
jgi:hypothetical protein